ncbi:hypothetical protein [Nocardia fluminea]|uniref:hypothetical protein n=1 Tax=Nocardia fluminea TaxID=134984 RepID=UPI0037AEA3B5
MVADEHQHAIAGFAAALAELRVESGKPSFATLHKLSEKLASEKSEDPRKKPGGRRWALPSSTACDAVKGTRLPALATVLAFVEACQLAAHEQGIPIAPSRFDATKWKHRWGAVANLHILQPQPAPTDRLNELDGELRAPVDATPAGEAEEIAVPSAGNSPTAGAGVEDRPSLYRLMSAAVDRCAVAYGGFVVDGLRTSYGVRFPSDRADSGNDR